MTFERVRKQRNPGRKAQSFKAKCRFIVTMPGSFIYLPPSVATRVERADQMKPPAGGTWCADLTVVAQFRRLRQVYPELTSQFSEGSSERQSAGGMKIAAVNTLAWLLLHKSGIALGSERWVVIELPTGDAGDQWPVA
jgi:hypothetical protein